MYAHPEAVHQTECRWINDFALLLFLMKLALLPIALHAIVVASKLSHGTFPCWRYAACHNRPESEAQPNDKKGVMHRGFNPNSAYVTFSKVET